MFKIVHNLIVFHPSIFVPCQSRTGPNAYLQPFAHTNSFLHSFVPSTISLWNSLPSNALAHLHFLSLKPTYMHLTCYIESDCLLSAHTPGGALVDLIFTYFVFDIAYPKSIICIAHHFVLGLTKRFQHLFPPRALLCPVIAFVYHLNSLQLCFSYTLHMQILFIVSKG